MDPTTLPAQTVDLFGMTLEITKLTVAPLNTAAFLYLFACIAYFMAVARSGNDTQSTWAKAGSFLSLLGLVCHTLGQAGRWYVGGVDRPPWTNLYESLVAFAWMLALGHVVLSRKWRIPLVGAISMPLVFVLMGMSVMTPNKSVEPLIPALQSYWLKIHVVFGMISYAGFTIAGCFAFLHLLKNRVSVSKIGAGFALTAFLNLAIAGGSLAFTSGQFQMAKTVVRTLPDGTEAFVKDTYRESENGAPITRMETVPFANIPFFASLAAFAAAGALFLARRKREVGGEGGLDTDPLAFGVFRLGLGLMAVFFATIGWGLHSSATLTLQSNPYLTLLLGMTFFFMLIFVVAVGRYKKFLAALPGAERLDELSYKCILFAFPFQTLLLITGAVWAYYAWGRSWGWDPKETWALITWFVYLIYLHGKLLMNWRPNLLSVLAIVGFVVLIFAFLGVNLVLSGLHSYGAA